MDISFCAYTGKEIQSHIGTLSQFRKDAFSLPPYSYCFDQKIEDEYMREYVSNNLSCLLCAINSKKKIIGLASGMPLSPDSVITEKAAVLFKKNKLNPRNFFYICEVIVLPEYRKKHIGEKLMEKIEEYAKKIGLKKSCLLTEITSKVPSNNHSLWSKMEYETTKMIETYTWPTYIKNDEVKTIEHELVYWIKKNV